MMAIFHWPKFMGSGGSLPLTQELKTHPDPDPDPDPSDCPDV